MDLRKELATVIEGEVHDDTETLMRYGRDASIFRQTPSIVVYPKHAEDVSRAVRVVRNLKKEGADVSITPRCAGTDMTGGPLTPSVSLVFTKYMNRMFEVEKFSEEKTVNSEKGLIEGTASCEPGILYKDFEKATLQKDLLMPAYPASRNIAAIGGMIANNCGGELTLRYGKIEQYVEALDVVLSDGSRIETRPLTPAELSEKESLPTLEGAIYRNIHALLEKNSEMIDAAQPDVSKNSSGYSLWNVMRPDGSFDLSQLILGSQGTLGIVTKSTLGLVRPKKHRAMLVIFLSDLKDLPQIVRRVLEFDPEAFESFDDKTFKLAMRFFPQLIGGFGLRKMFSLGLAFIPEMKMVLTGGVPRLILIAEFSEDTVEEADRKASEAKASLAGMSLRARTAKEGLSSEKYWIVRRESFNLLRKNFVGLSAAAFIDDIIIPPDTYPVFLPKLWALLEEYELLYTIAGHIGNGNLHIIPLIDFKKPETAKMIAELTPRVYKLVVAHGGSITAEHSDGIMRTPYLGLQFGARMNDLFKEVKEIFDPLNILNPGKKIGGTEADITRLMRRS